MLEGTDGEFEIAKELLKKQNIKLGRDTLDKLSHYTKEFTIFYIGGELRRYARESWFRMKQANIFIRDTTKMLTINL